MEFASTNRLNNDKKKIKVKKCRNSQFLTFISCFKNKSVLFAALAQREKIIVVFYINELVLSLIKGHVLLPCHFLKRFFQKQCCHIELKK